LLLPALLRSPSSQFDVARGFSSLGGVAPLLIELSVVVRLLLCLNLAVPIEQGILGRARERRGEHDQEEAYRQRQLGLDHLGIGLPTEQSVKVPGRAGCDARSASVATMFRARGTRA